MASSASAAAIVCVLGIPAAGKTTFCSRLLRKLEINFPQLSICRVCFDELFSSKEQKELINNMKWKTTRRLLTEVIDKLLQDRTLKETVSVAHNTLNSMKLKILEMNHLARVSNDNQTLILIDDNLYYGSMRYDFFQLAKKYHCGFGQLYIACSVKTALERNKQRVSQVPPTVIINMATKLEEPLPSKNSWERSTLILNGEEIIAEAQLNDAVDMIKKTLANPVECEENLVQKELSQAVTASNTIHQIDKILRNIVGSKIKRSCDDHSKTNELRRYSSNLNVAKRLVVDGIRNSTLMIPSQIVQQIESGSMHQALPDLQHLLTHYLDEKLNEIEVT